MTYQTPKVQRFGSFRELTQVGANGANDILAVAGTPSGCHPGGDPTDCRTS